MQVRKNVFWLRHIEGKRERDASAQKPFTTTRLLVGQFQEAESLLRKAIREICNGGLFQVSPIVVIHPKDMVEGGLSEVKKGRLENSPWAAVQDVLIILLSTDSVSWTHFFSLEEVDTHPLRHDGRGHRSPVASVPA